MICILDHRTGWQFEGPSRGGEGQLRVRDKVRTHARPPMCMHQPLPIPILDC
jgi:hypothetical protein